MLERLYPAPLLRRPLQGTYLDCNLHQQAKAGQVFIYANYISSLDGRISLWDTQIDDYAVPKDIANGRDWRLYQELAGQCDVMLTSARYFRQLAVGKAQDLLPVGSSPDYQDIQLWRKQQGLKAQPDVVVMSNSLDIPLEAVFALKERKIIVFTTAQSSESARRSLQDAGVEVVVAPDKVDGRFIRRMLVQRHYRSAYMIAGPKVHHTLLADACLDELFLTSYMALLGGKDYHTVLEDDLPQTVKMQLLSLYLDAQAGQMLMRYRLEHA
ncbi:MAG: dihydrofolate reductase family protein [Mariprofundaceae bacterium]|nr:dihydrofolate reductase family protein [Mariprofundaceae bacterium]